jgi:hypothetical protein
MTISKKQQGLNVEEAYKRMQEKRQQAAQLSQKEKETPPAVEVSLEEAKKELNKVEKELEKVADELEEKTLEEKETRSEFSANISLSGEKTKPGFYIKKGDTKLSDRHDTMDKAMASYKSLSDTDRKGAKIVNEDLEVIFEETEVLEEAIMNPEHDEKDQVMLKKLHKHMPELNIKNAVHTGTSKNKNGTSFNTYKVDLPVPDHLQRLFKTLSVGVNTEHHGDHHDASVHYSYTHPDGGSNGSTIGILTHHEGKHYFSARDGKHNPAETI